MKKERYSFFQKEKQTRRTDQEWPRAKTDDEWPRSRGGQDTCFAPPRSEKANPTFVPPPPKKICQLCQQKASGFRKLACEHLFCGSCADHHETLFNQCPTCHCVLNPDVHHMFASELPVIPSYESFDYPSDLNEEAGIHSQ